MDHMYAQHLLMVPLKDWDDNDNKKQSVYAKAMNISYHCLKAEEFYRLSMWISAKDIWNTLDVIHEV